MPITQSHQIPSPSAPTTPAADNPFLALHKMIVQTETALQAQLNTSPSIIDLGRIALSLQRMVKARVELAKMQHLEFAHIPSDEFHYAPVPKTVKVPMARKSQSNAANTAEAREKKSRQIKRISERIARLQAQIQTHQSERANANLRPSESFQNLFDFTRTLSKTLKSVSGAETANSQIPPIASNLPGANRNSPAATHPYPDACKDRELTIHQLEALRPHTSLSRLETALPISPP